MQERRNMTAQRIINDSGRIGVFFLLLFSLMAGRGTLLADDILPRSAGGREDEVIIRTFIAGEPDRPAVYNLKRWVVEENTDPVNRALEVYKKKSKPGYTRRIWLTGKADGKKRLIAEYVSLGGGDKVVFSPNEDFMYYLGLTPGGQSMVYGVNLLSNKKFSLGSGDGFQAVNCPDKTSYVVVQPDGQSTIYQVYTSAGEPLEALTDLESPLDIEKNLCH
jgi:hypothetical protein